MKFTNRLQPPPQLPLQQQQQQPSHDEVNNNLNESKFESFHTGTNNNNNNNNNNNSKGQLSTEQLPKKSQSDVDGLEDDDNVAVYELNPSFKIEVRDPVSFLSLSGLGYPEQCWTWRPWLEIFLRFKMYLIHSETKMTIMVFSKQ